MRALIQRRVAWAPMALVFAVALLVAGCGRTTASPGVPVATTPDATVLAGASPSEVAAPSGAPSPSASPTTAGGIPPLLATVPGFDVTPIEPLVLDGFAAAARAFLGTNAGLGDAVGARATGAGNDPVDLIAFTLLPATGVSENDALFLVMGGLAEGAGAEWVADEAIGWFALDHDSGRALMIPWGNVQGGTVFLLVVGAGDAPVDDVANAVLEAG